MKRACIKLNANKDEQIASFPALRGPFKINVVRMKENRFDIRHIVFPLLCLLIATGCTPISRMKYLSMDDHAVPLSFYNDRKEKTIQPYDYLYIRIYSLDERTNNMFNFERSQNFNMELLSYAVDDRGNISFPFIGNVEVKNLTINQAKEKIERSLSAFLNNISVTVRFVGNKITVLGEVQVPGQFTFFDEKVTVFQAIGYARGSGNFADHRNITLIREIDNKISYHKMDLTSRRIAESPYYYLLPNDIVIVNPVNTKYRELRRYSLNLVSTLVSSALSGIALYVAINQLNKQ